MSKTIDEEVVELTFDNSKFESNVKTSMSTIEKLKNALNFKGTSDGLDKLSKSAKSLDMSSATQSVGVLQAKFSALEVAGMTAIANITTSAMQMGTQLADALTIAPIRAGFEEYETQMGAIQTILANTSSKGSSLDDVNSALDELNKYADQTIYNFTEMTKNIGTFTAAGVGLEDSVSAIKGIANLAAVSGSTSTQASTAMYQLSQALAAGTVKLQDWNSVVNAGMGGEVFQNALKRTSRMMKDTVSDYSYDVDALIEKNGSFRESLSEGWLTTDVLTETLAEIAGAYSESELLAKGYTESQAQEILSLGQTATEAATKVKTFTQLIDTTQEALGSGWTQTWEIIIGDFEQAKELWTGISDFLNNFITSVSDARNNFLSEVLGSPWEKLTAQIEATGVPLDDFTAKLKEVAIQNGVLTEDMITSAGSLEKTLSSGWLTTDIFNQTIDAMSESSVAVEDMTDKLEYFQKVVDEVWYGTWDNGAARVEKLTEAGYDYAEVQALVNKTVDGHRLTLEDLDVETATAIGYTEDQIKALQQLKSAASESGSSMEELINSMSKKSGRELALEALTNIAQTFITVCQNVKQAWSNAFPPASTTNVYNAIKAFNKFSASLSEGVSSKMQSFQNALTGVFKVLKLVSTFISGTFSVVFTHLGKNLGIIAGDAVDFAGTIGDLLTKFTDWVEQTGLIETAIKGLDDALTALETILQPIVDAVKNFFTELTTSEDPAGYLVNSIVTAFNTINSVVGSKVGEIGGVLRSAFASLPSEMVAGFMSGLSSEVGSVFQAMMSFAQNIIDTVCGILGIHSPSTVFKEIGENVIQGFIDGVISKLGSATEAVSGVIQTIISNVQNGIAGFDWSKAPAIALSAGMFAGFYKLANILNTFVGAFDKFAGVAQSFKNVADALAKGITSITQAVKTNINIQSFKALAAGLGVIVGCFAIIVGLVHFASPEELQTAFALVVTFMTLLELMMLSMTQIAKHANLGDIGKVSTFVAAIGAAMLMMSLSVAIIGMVDSSKIAMAIALIGEFGVLVTTLMIVSKVAKPKQLTALAATISAIASVFVAMAACVWIIGTMDETALGRGLAAVYMFSYIVAVLVLVGGLAQLVAGNGLGLAATMGSISSVFVAMAACTVILGKLDQAELARGLGAVIAFAAVISALAVVGALATRIAGPGGGIASASILSIAGSIAIMAIACRILGGMDEASLRKGVAAVAVLETLAIGMVAATSHLSGGKGAKVAATLIAMALCVGIMAAVAVVLGMVDEESLRKGVTAVSVLGVIVSLMTAAVSGLDAKSTGKIIALAIMVGVLAAAVYVFSTLDQASLQSATACISALLAAMGLLAAGVGQAGKAKATLVVMALVVAALGGIVYALCASGTDYSGAIEAAAAIGVLLVSMGVVMKILSTMSGLTDASVKTLSKLTLVMAELLLSVAGIALVLGVVQSSAGSLDPANAVAISTVLLAMTEVFAALMAVNKYVKGITWKEAGQVAIAFDVVTAIVTGLIALMGGINQFTDGGFAKTLNEAIPVMEGIGAALGSLIGSFVGNLAGTAIGGVLTGISSELVSFSANMITVAENFSQIQNGSFSVVGEIAAGIAQLTGAEFLTSVADFIAKGDLIGQALIDIEDIGTALSKFSDNLGGDFDASKVKNAAEAAKYLGEFIENVPKKGGIAQSIFGTTMDMSDFGDQIAAFMRSMSEVCALANASSFDAGSLQSAMTACKAVTEFAEGVPKTGGFLNSAFFGEQDFAAFGEGITSFMESMSNVSALAAQSSFNGEVLQSAMTACKAVTEFAEGVPKTGGFLNSAFFGEQDFAGFGTSIKSFMSSMCDVCVYAAGITQSSENLQSAMTACKAVTEFAKTVPSSGGILDSIFFGEANMETFGSQMKSFFASMVEAFGADSGIANIDLGLIDQAIAAAGRLVSFMTSDTVSSLDTGIVDKWNQFWGGGGDGTGELAGSFENLGNALTAFSDSTSTLDEGSFQKANAAVESLNQLAGTLSTMSTIDISGVDAYVDALTKLGTTSVDAIVAGFEGANERVSAAISSLTSTISTTIASAVSTVGSNMTVYGANYANGIIQGFSAAFAGFGTALSTQIAGAVSAVSSYTGQFNSAGNALGTNLTKGATEGLSSFSTVFTNAINSAAAAAESAYGRFYSAGYNAGIGFANGISSSAFAATIAARAMANAAATAAQAALNEHSPSKVMYGIGAYAGEGFTNALNDYASVSYKAGTNIGQKSIDGLKDIMYKASAISDGRYSFQPSITPVMNLDKIQNGFTRLNGSPLVARGVLNTAYTINDNIGSSQMSMLSSMIDALNQLDDSKFVDKLDELSTNMKSYTDAVANSETAMYVDGKKLASTIAKPMNKALGTMAREGR